MNNVNNNDNNRPNQMLANLRNQHNHQQALNYFAVAANHGQVNAVAHLALAYQAGAHAGHVHNPRPGV